jgi:hypothetical protein
LVGQTTKEAKKMFRKILVAEEFRDKVKALQYSEFASDEELIEGLKSFIAGSTLRKKIRNFKIEHDGERIKVGFELNGKPVQIEDFRKFLSALKRLDLPYKREYVFSMLLNANDLIGAKNELDLEKRKAFAGYNSDNEIKDYDRNNLYPPKRYILKTYPLLKYLEEEGGVKFLPNQHPYDKMKVFFEFIRPLARLSGVNIELLTKLNDLYTMLGVAKKQGFDVKKLKDKLEEILVKENNATKALERALGRKGVKISGHPNDNSKQIIEREIEKFAKWIESKEEFLRGISQRSSRKQKEVRETRNLNRRRRRI